MPSMIETLMQTAESDTELLIKNDQAGDDFSVFREVDFLLIAPSEEKANLVASFINDFNYGKVESSCVNSQHRILVQIEMPITQNVLCSISGFMACLCKLYDLEYDGWGSEIQSNS